MPRRKKPASLSASPFTASPSHQSPPTVAPFQALTNGTAIKKFKPENPKLSTIAQLMEIASITPKDVTEAKLRWADDAPGDFDGLLDAAARAQQSPESP